MLKANGRISGISQLIFSFCLSWTLWYRYPTNTSPTSSFCTFCQAQFFWHICWTLKTTENPPASPSSLAPWNPRGSGSQARGLQERQGGRQRAARAGAAQEAAEKLWITSRLQRLVKKGWRWMKWQGSVFSPFRYVNLSKILISVGTPKAGSFRIAFFGDWMALESLCHAKQKHRPQASVDLPVSFQTNQELDWIRAPSTHKIWTCTFDSL